MPRLKTYRSELAREARETLHRSRVALHTLSRVLAARIDARERRIAVILPADRWRDVVLPAEQPRPEKAYFSSLYIDLSEITYAGADREVEELEAWSTRQWAAVRGAQPVELPEHLAADPEPPGPEAEWWQWEAWQRDVAEQPKRCAEWLRSRSQGEGANRFDAEGVDDILSAQAAERKALEAAAVELRIGQVAGDPLVTVDVELARALVREARSRRARHGDEQAWRRSRWQLRREQAIRLSERSTQAVVARLSREMRAELIGAFEQLGQDPRDPQLAAWVTEAVQERGPYQGYLLRLQQLAPRLAELRAGAEVMQA